MALAMEKTSDLPITEDKDSLFAVTNLFPIERLHNPSATEVMEKLILPNRAAILTGVVDSWPCHRKWTMEYIAERVGNVKVQVPKEFGVYHFLKFKSIPVAEFVESLNTTKDLYLSADPIMGEGGGVREECELKALAGDIPIPDFIPKDDIRNCNLWIGPGGNRSLLHYDAWHSFLAVFSGQKRFTVYHPAETRYLHQFGVFDIKALREGRTMDSRVDPVHVQKKYLHSVGQVTGFEGVIKPGEALFIPAGTWHYVESHGLNIALNFFFHARIGGLWNESPLKEYVFKTEVMYPFLNKLSKIKGAVEFWKKH